MARDLHSDFDSMFSRSGATLPRGEYGSFFNWSLCHFGLVLKLYFFLFSFEFTKQMSFIKNKYTLIKKLRIKNYFKL